MLEMWLCKHGRHVRSLVVRYDSSNNHLRLQLPWAQLTLLQTLSLEHIELPAIQQTGSNSGSSGSSTPDSPAATTPLLPRLKELNIQSCTLYSAKCLLQLAASPHLTSFKFDSSGSFSSLGGGRWYSIPAEVQQQVDTDVCAMLQQLQQQLRVLQVRGLPASCAVLPHVAAMQHLQSLDLDVTADSASSPSTTALPHSLTSLRLSDPGYPCDALPIKLQQLSSLQELNFSSGAVQPSVFASLTQLQSLELEYCSLVPDEPQQGVVALLQVLQKLTCLQRLWLDNTDRLDQTAEQSLHLFSALTASSQLTALGLIGFAQPLPQAAAQFIFPAGRQLPRLQELSIAFSFRHDMLEQTGWCLDSADLSSIVSACPALRKLEISGVVRKGADVSALSRLPETCQRLVVKGDAFDEDAAWVVAELSQLTYLGWHHCTSLTDRGLEVLTALWDLEVLAMSHCYSISYELCAAVSTLDWFQTEFQSSNDQGPVWRQLKELCYKSSECVERCSQQWAKDYEAPMGEVDELQQQLADKDAQLADKDAQLAARDAQLAASNAEVDRLRQALAARDG